MKLCSPEPLRSDHRAENFDCGILSLNEWLKKKALRNQTSGASRTFVTCEDKRIVGYYALASGAVAQQSASGRFRRNMPDPIPVIILGRLAVAASHKGKGLGRGLFQDAAVRVLQAADSIGIRGLLVHAINEEARAFYYRLGFDASPLDPMTLMITLKDVSACFSETGEEYQ